ncbi:hypothetical protein ACKI1J_43015 [Streptomyces scabiei]|uniref:hypothetical protein n=1 Tax=Streptomyces scabiei TaxID=1930 RepID=UPI0038F69FD5
MQANRTGTGESLRDVPTGGDGIRTGGFHTGGFLTGAILEQGTHTSHDGRLWRNDPGSD